MADLLSLCPEILHNLFLHVDATDLGRLSQTCHFLRDFIGRDDLIWKRLYSYNFDEPAQKPSSWQEALQNLVRFQKILESKDVDMKRSHLELVANTAFDLIQHTRSSQPFRNQAFLKRHFDDRRNVSHFLRQSSLFRNCGLPYDEPAQTPELCQLSAKLHVFYGLEAEIRDEELHEVESALDIHPYARSRVYDLRRYRTESHWGPFMDDGSGRVDWERVQCVMIVLAHGLRMLCERTNGSVGPLPFWGRPFNGLARDSFVSSLFEERAVGAGAGGAAQCSFAAANTLHHRHNHNHLCQDLDARDPYGVRGTWMRVVNFLDYHDLFEFNFGAAAPPDDQDRPPVTTPEAFRLILLKLWITRIEEPADDDPKGMPKVHFEGKSRSLHMRWDPNANSQIRGYVCTSPHGDVRWTTFSVFHGEERWRSEGVQIGGIRSGRGVLGNWFDKDFDPHGPAGPTAFWKISNDFSKGLDGE